MLESYAAFNRGDHDSLLALLDPSVEFDVGGEGYLHGLDEVRGYLHGLSLAFESLRYEVGEAREAEPNVIVLVRSSARGRTSGIATEAATAHLWTFTGERVVRFRVYSKQSEGIEAFESHRGQRDQTLRR